MVTLFGRSWVIGGCKRPRAARARLLTSQAGRARCPRRCCCSPLDRSQRRSARKHPRVSGVGSRGDSVLLLRSRLSSCRRGSCDAGLYHGRRAGSSTASSQCAAARCSCRRNQRSLGHGTTPGHTDQLEDEKECTGQVQRGRSPYLMLESGQGMTLEDCRRSSYRSRCFLAVRSGCRCPTRERPLVSETASALKSGCGLLRRNR